MTTGIEFLWIGNQPRTAIATDISILYVGKLGRVAGESKRQDRVYQSLLIFLGRRSPKYMRSVCITRG